jgi:probable rRNA maturation factor
VLCPAVAAAQAQQAGHSAQAELELLCVHGILHLLGYDHADAEEEAEMFGLQGELLRAWRADRAAGQADSGDSADGAVGAQEGQEGPG